MLTAPEKPQLMAGELITLVEKLLDEMPVY